MVRVLELGCSDSVCFISGCFFLSLPFLRSTFHFACVSAVTGSPYIMAHEDLLTRNACANYHGLKPSLAVRKEYPVHHLYKDNSNTYSGDFRILHFFRPPPRLPQLPRCMNTLPGHLDRSLPPHLNVKAAGENSSRHHELLFSIY